MSEIAEVKKLIRLSTFDGVKNVLKSYLSKLEAALPPTPPPSTSIDNDKKDIKVTSPTVDTISPSSSTNITFLPISDFAWDQGEYGSAFVTIYIDFPSIGTSKDSVSCEFTKDSFDLKILNFDNKNYRLFKDNLDKDIVPSNSKYIVKANKILIKLGKTKNDIGYEQWMSLTAKNPDRKKQEAGGKGADPMGGIMDMMKDMYETGDDNMKKIIGEAMMKSRDGVQSGFKDDPGMGMEGLGGDMKLPDLPSMPGL